MFTHHEDVGGAAGPTPDATLSFVYSYDADGAGHLEPALGPEPSALSTWFLDSIRYDAASANGGCGLVSEDRVCFVGREFDAERAVADLTARSYDPRIGRWLSLDPVGFSTADPNLYRYVAAPSPTPEPPADAPDACR